MSFIRRNLDTDIHTGKMSHEDEEEDGKDVSL